MTKYRCLQCEDPCVLDIAMEAVCAPRCCPFGGAAVFEIWEDQEPYHIDRLIAAAIKTLADNRHLADGDQCTLRELRDAVDGLLVTFKNKTIDLT
jgi:hypothetical protein